MSEKEIISAIKEGDREAFNKLYGFYWANLVSYASLIVGTKSSKDIVHDIFLKVWMNRESLHDTTTLRPYLMRSVYNMSLNVLRNTSRLQTVDSQIDYLVAQTYNPDNSEIIKRLYDRDTQLQIEEAVKQLPERCQAIFRRSYMDGLSHKEIAEEFRISVSTVDNQIFKALKILRSLLSESTFILLMWTIAN